jgi:hypothetical protein
MVWGFRMAGSGPIASGSPVNPGPLDGSSPEVIGAVVVDHSEPAAFPASHEEISRLPASDDEMGLA